MCIFDVATKSCPSGLANQDLGRALRTYAASRNYSAVLLIRLDSWLRCHKQYRNDMSATNTDKTWVSLLPSSERGIIRIFEERLLIVVACPIICPKMTPQTAHAVLRLWCHI